MKTPKEPASRSSPATIEPLWPSNCLASGLRKADSEFLSAITKDYPSVAHLFSESGNEKSREKVVRICEDVVNAVGFGDVDHALLGHYIRHVVFVAAKAYDPLFWLPSRRPLSTQLADYLANEETIAEELADAFDRLDADTSRIKSKRFRAGMQMTARWVRGGGVRTYRFSLTVLHSAAVSHPILLRTVSPDRIDSDLQKAYSEAALPWPHQVKPMRSHDALTSDRGDLPVASESNYIELAALTGAIDASPSRRHYLREFCTLLTRGERRFVQEWLSSGTT